MVGVSAERPNLIHFHRGSTTFGEDFGPISHVTPVHHGGNGHRPHVQVRAVGGLMLDMTPETLLQLLCEGKAALRKLPGCAPNISGALADLGDDE